MSKSLEEELRTMEIAEWDGDLKKALLGNIDDLKDSGYVDVMRIARIQILRSLNRIEALLLENLNKQQNDLNDRKDHQRNG